MIKHWASGGHLRQPACSERTLKRGRVAGTVWRGERGRKDGDASSRSVLRPRTHILYRELFFGGRGRIGLVRRSCQTVLVEEGDAALGAPDRQLHLKGGKFVPAEDNFRQAHRFQQEVVAIFAGYTQLQESNLSRIDVFRDPVQTQHRRIGPCAIPVNFHLWCGQSVGKCTRWSSRPCRKGPKVLYHGAGG